MAHIKFWLLNVATFIEIQVTKHECIRYLKRLAASAASERAMSQLSHLSLAKRNRISSRMTNARAVIRHAQI